MVIRDFFNTDLTIGNDNVELSDNVDDLSLAYPDGWSDAYWYGWMHWENVPDALKLTTIEMSGEGYDLTVSADYGSPRNFNIGYMAAGLEGSAINWYTNPYGARGFIENSGVYLDPVSDVAPFFGSRFINSLDPRGVCPIHGGSSNTEYHSICFVFQVQRVYNGDERDGYNNFSFHTFSDFTQTDGNAIEEFLNGDYSINLKATSYTLWDNTPSVSYYCNFDFDLNINDSEHFGSEHPNTWTFRFNYSGVEHILNVFICGFGFPRGADAISENAGYEYKTFGISPVVSQNIEGVDFKSIGAQNYYNFVKFNSLGQLVNYDSGLIHNNFYFDNYSYGGYNGSVNIVDNGKNCYGITFDNEANYAVVMERHSGGPTADNLWCFRILSPDEIRHTMCLNMRYVTNDDYTQYSYGFGEGIYVPKITPDNEFLGEWLTGDFEDIEDELRPWQYKNIRDNTYDPNQPEPSGANNFYFGGNQIQSLYYGENEIQALYYGPYLIFPTTPPTPSNPYTEISYIEATGTQYINTGYTQQSNSLRIKMTVRPAFGGNTGKIIAAPNFGLSVAWYQTMQGRFYGINFYVNDSALFSGSTWHDPQSYFTEVEAILNPTTAQLLQDSGTSGSGTGSDASISASSPYCIFSEAGQELLQCQLSACQIYDNEVLVRDFIPVLRNSDNKPGLLDRVNNQFYTNAGTGEFIYYE